MSDETEDSVVRRIDEATMHDEAWWVRLMDGALTDEERRAWQAHLGHCPDCRREWSMVSAVEEALLSAPAPPRLSPDFTIVTTQRILQRQRRRRLLSALVGTLIVVAITAVILRYLGAAYMAVESTVSAVLAARQMLFRSLMHILVGLMVSWRAVLPFVAGLTLLVYLIVMPNGLMVTAALLWLSRRRRDAGLMEVNHA